MKTIKNYLLGRTVSAPAWIGFIGIILELLLHLGNISSLMLVFFVLLIALPEAKLTGLFGEWTKKIKDAQQ